MSKPCVLLIGDLTHTNKEWAAYSSKYELKEYRTGSRDDFLSKCKTGKFDGVVGLYRSNQSASETGPFDRELVSVLPSSLKYICHNGAGYDNIDVPACTQRNILISSTPIAVDNATADVGIFLLLGALRQAHIPLMAIRAGQWRGNTPIGHDPKDKVLGILGMGGIGRVSLPIRLNARN
jgi:glyoxylate reductase